MDPHVLLCSRAGLFGNNVDGQRIVLFDLSLPLVKGVGDRM